MRLTLLSAGYCTAPEHLVIRSGHWRRMKLPALFALLEHPREGVVLFDTGYSARFFEATARFPESLYARLTPVHLDAHEEPTAQLARRGIAPEDVRQIVVSHFHADHVGALRDFPRARFRFFEDAYEAVRGRRGLSGLRRAFLPSLLPEDFEGRALPLRVDDLRPMAGGAPFRGAVDLFGDGSALALRLPGHAAGQLGLLVTEGSGRRTLLCADACWHRLALTGGVLPFPLLMMINADQPRYHATLSRLRRFMDRWPDVWVVPSHCAESARRFAAE